VYYTASYCTHSASINYSQNNWAVTARVRNVFNEALPKVDDAGVFSIPNIPLGVGYMKATSKRGDYILEVRPTNNMTTQPITFAADKMELTSFFWLNNKKLWSAFVKTFKMGTKITE
jgi:hypothetical protein